MAEGFSSIADLKVSVDANTEQLKGGLALAHNIVQRFAGEGSQSLGRFDAAVAKVGGTIDVVRGKLGVWLMAIETLGQALARFRGQGDSLATALGKRDDWEKIGAAVDDLADAVQEGLSAAWEQATGSAKEYAGVARAASQASAGGVQGLSLTGGTDKIVEVIGGISHAFRRVKQDSEWSSQTIEREFDLVADKANDFSSEVRRIMAEGSSIGDIFGLDLISQNIEQLAAMLDRVEEVKAIAARNAAANSAKERAAAEAQGEELTGKLIPAIEKEVMALERKAATYNLTKGEAAAYAITMKVLEELSAKELLLSEAHAELLGNLVARVKEVHDAEDRRAKAKLEHEKGDKLIEGLQREIRELDRQKAALGASTAEIAANSIELKYRNQIEDQSIKLSASQRAEFEKMLPILKAKAQAVADEKKAVTEADRQEKAFEAVILGLQRETNGLLQKTAAQRDASEEGQIAARVEKELQDLRAKNVDVDDKRLASIKAEATANVQAARAYEQARHQMALLQESGRVIAGNLESAFARWTDGAKLNVRDMVRSMIADMAQLTFRKGFVEALFGGGGSSGGGIFASMFSGMFGGARALGGPVASGRAYLVGEEGPELFMPSASGTIIPNGAIRGGAAGGAVSVHLHNTIDARGAYPESIAEIRAALAQQQAGLPGEVVRVVREAQDRGIA